MSSDDFAALKVAIEKLQLTDPAVTIAPDTKYLHSSYICISKSSKSVS